jgi:hypothetical protein
MARAACVVIAVIAVLGSGCGSGSGDAAAPAATEDSASYRHSVNGLFDRVVAARGDYEHAQGVKAVRAAGEALDRETQAALARLKTLDPPARARALQAQLDARLGELHRDLAAALASRPLDTDKLGAAVRETTPADRVVSAINVLP